MRYKHEDRTARHLAILRYVDGYIATHKISPTLQDVAVALELSKSVIYKEVHLMCGRGLLKRLPYKARTLTVAPLGRMALEEGEAVWTTLGLSATKTATS